MKGTSRIDAVLESICQRFNLYVRKTDDCWEWQGALDKAGYGYFWLGKTVRAHRAAYILCHGSVPIGLNVLHRCDNRRCVRVDHLYVGTPTDNAKDCVERGRHPSRDPQFGRKISASLSGRPKSVAHIEAVRKALRRWAITPAGRAHFHRIEQLRWNKHALPNI